MTEKDKRELELDFLAYDTALELWHAWKDYYSEWLTFDEYVVKVAAYLDDAFYNIKEDIENIDDEE